MNRADYEDDQQTLKGIAALLLSLSVLAAFLCVLPLSLRARILSILRRGEAAARAFAIEQSGGALSLPAVPAADGDSRADALHLARCLRALARFFCGLHGCNQQQPFRSKPNPLLALLKPALAWRGQAMHGRHAMAFRHTACIDTS